MTKDFWDPNDSDVLEFFEQHPIKKKHDSEIASCDLDILIFAIKHFKSKMSQSEFAEKYVEIRSNRKWYDLDYIKFVVIPIQFFKGYFHPWDGNNCLIDVRIGNPTNPAYKYSYESPATRNYLIEDAFSKGSIPCPKCFYEELKDLRDKFD